MEREAREEQEQLAFDMKILEALLEASRNEAMEQAQRKVSGYRSIDNLKSHSLRFCSPVQAIQ